MKRITGHYEQQDDLKYFIPLPLPPQNPAFNMDHSLIELYATATQKLGIINEVGKKIPNIDRFIKAYVIKEARLSSKIEGVHTTTIQVYEQAMGGEKLNKETQMVLNYTLALNTALNKLQDNKTFKVSDVLLEAHKVLMQFSPQSSPGQFRKITVRLGSFYPPPAEKITDLMEELTQFINKGSEDSPNLIQIGLVHAQFETIHPFVDGNGRLGRLLILLMLMQNNLLTLPILYPSYAFKKYQMEYYRRLTNTRTTGDFEGWITYFLHSIVESCDETYRTIEKIELLEKKIKAIIQEDIVFQKSKENALEFLEILFQNPVTSVNQLKINSEKSYNTADLFIKKFIHLGLLTELKDKEGKYNKHYAFMPYIDILDEDE